jgi:hypothetical protein
MGQLVNHTSFQFNGTVVETLSVGISYSFLKIIGFAIFERFSGEHAIGSLLVYCSQSKQCSSIHPVAHPSAGHLRVFDIEGDDQGRQGNLGRDLAGNIRPGHSLQSFKNRWPLNLGSRSHALFLFWWRAILVSPQADKHGNDPLAGDL